MNRPLNIALIGFGRMGKIYARTIARTERARLFAVATEALDAEAASLSELNVVHLLEDGSEAVAMETVDAVVIATPTDTHHTLVLEAAAAGKAIFCEKPLALTLEDTREMIDAAKRAGVPLQAGFMRRFDPAYQEAKAAIEAGKIGRPTTFKAIGRDPFCPDPAYADPAVSGGLIVDMAIHDMDLARWLMRSEVDAVSAYGTTLVCDALREVDDYDNAVVNLHFANGALGNVEVSRHASYAYDVRTEVLGSNGAVRVGHDRLGPEMLLKADPKAATSYLVRRFGEAYDAQIRAFVSSIHDGRPVACTGEDALAALEISLAATYSARTGQPVSLDDVRSGWTPSLQSA